MNNATIIFMERVKLMESGVIKGTGEKTIIEEPDGTKKEYEVPEQIHTYQKWKSLGYQVKKGQKAIAQFPIWKYTKKKDDKMSEEEAQDKGYCFMKVSSWFKFDQVEKVEEGVSND